MKEFKVGDKVRLVGEQQPFGCVAKIEYPDTMNCIIERYDGKGWIRDNSVPETYKNIYSNTYWFIKHQELELLEEEIFINKWNKNIMSKALDFVKELTLTSDEKLLRKWGLKDNEGNYTHDSEKIVILKLVEDNKEHLLSIAQGLEDKEKASK